jgi:hypothetical protein
LSHRNILSFAAEYARPASPIRSGYLLLNALAAAFLILRLFWEPETPMAKLLQLSGGIFATFLLLLPLHELIHALSYRWYGAPNVKVIYNWRRLTACAFADNFVICGRELFWIAIMPFLVISAALLLLMVASEGADVFLATLLLLHTLACSGDFALLNYRWLHRGAELWTYDNSALQRTYFYRAARPATMESPAWKHPSAAGG